MMLQCDEYWENWDDEARHIDFLLFEEYNPYNIEEEMEFYDQFSSEQDYKEYLAAHNALE